MTANTTYYHRISPAHPWVEMATDDPHTERFQRGELMVRWLAPCDGGVVVVRSGTESGSALRKWIRRRLHRPPVVKWGDARKILGP